MSLETHSFEFGEFRIDNEEKVLLRGGNPVPITPKAFLLLQTLVKNHGHLVEKDTLMKSVWPDSFVEEGNLSFTVNLLRKALGDSRTDPRFIETVPKRGYRFIYDVTEHFPAGNGVAPGRPPGYGFQPQAARPGYYGLIAAGGALLLIVAVSLLIGSRYFGENQNNEAAILSAPFGMEKVSANGRTRLATVSRDGKNVVFVDMSSGLQSVWIRQLQSNSNVELIPASDQIYGGFAFSYSGSSLFFVRGTLGDLKLFRMPVIGGPPVKITSEIQGSIDVSPDDGKVSFVRCYYRDDDSCSIFVADAADGKNEKRLVTRPRPLRIGPHKFSPDGKELIFAVGQSENQANEFALSKVNVETGVETEVSPERFFNINGIALLPGNAGILLTASRTPSLHYSRIWQISASSPVAVPISKDSETYAGLSIDKTGTVLLATRIEQDFQLNIFQMDNPTVEPRFLGNAAEADFAAGGKVVFTSRQTGNDEIWSINFDGAGKRQLTSDPADEGSPVVSPDGNTIFFSSNRSGETQVWRMSSDGGSQVQVTKVEGGYPRAVTIDGWVYYLSGRGRDLRRVRSAGGVEEMVLNRSSSIEIVAILPDGTKIAFITKQNGSKTIEVVSLPGGTVIKDFALPELNAEVAGLDWTADGKSLAYFLVHGGRATLWLQPLDTAEVTRHADLGTEVPAEQSGFSCSPDGKFFTLSKGGWKHDAVLFTGLK